MHTIGRYFTHGLLLAGLVALAGCSNDATRGPGGTDKDARGEHGHLTGGPHKGVLVDWGKGEYHAEFVVNHAKKQATVYILDSEAKEPAAIDAESITLSLTNVNPVMHVELKADPQKGDPQGKSSRFTGTDDVLGIEMDFKGLIVGNDGKTPYSGELDETGAHKDHHH
jgi:hypothetical protein